MKKLLFLSIMLCFLPVSIYSQSENSMIKTILQCYIQYYALSNPPEKKMPVSLSIQDSAIFFASFDTENIRFFYLQKEGKPGNFFSFKDTALPPLKGEMIVTSPYGLRYSPFNELNAKSKLKMHYGVDFRVEEKIDTVYSVFSGVVRISKLDAGYGNVVLIRNFNMSETIYAHLYSRFVNAFQEVKAGQPIGIAGNTGSSTAAHLHFEIRWQGFPINPVYENKLLRKFSVKYKNTN